MVELIPIFGKVVSLIFALSLFRLACQCGLPRSIKRRMLYHISIDFLVNIYIIYLYLKKNTDRLKKQTKKAWFNSYFGHPVEYVVQSA